MKCPNDSSELRDLGNGNFQCPRCPFNAPKNTKRLETMHAWVAVDRDDKEGFMAVEIQGTRMVLCHSELSMAQRLRPEAQRAVRGLPGYRARLIKFTARETLEEL